MKHLKHHAAHVLMCAPMIVIAIALLASGAGFGALIPLVGCMLMMGMMMSMMGGGSGSRR